MKQQPYDKSFNLKSYKDPSVLNIIDKTNAPKEPTRFKDMERGDMYVREGAVSMCVEHNNILMTCNLATGRVWQCAKDDIVKRIEEATLSIVKEVN